MFKAEHKEPTRVKISFKTTKPTRTLYSNYMLVSQIDNKGQTICSQRWRLDFRALLGTDKIEMHMKGSRTGKGDKTYRYNVIVVDYEMTRENFIKTMKRHFSLQWGTEPSEIRLVMQNYLALWGEAKQ